MAKLKGNKNIDVDRSLRRIWGTFNNVQFTPNNARNHNNGQIGTDLIIKHSKTTYYIEIEGLDEIAHVNEKNFHRSFFRILTRMKLHKGKDNFKLVIAFPADIGDGKGRRQNFGKEAWGRISKAFPMLEFWRVDTRKDEVIMYPWEIYGE